MKAQEPNRTQRSIAIADSFNKSFDTRRLSHDEFQEKLKLPQLPGLMEQLFPDAEKHTNIYKQCRSDSTPRVDVFSFPGLVNMKTLNQSRLNKIAKAKQRRAKSQVNLNANVLYQSCKVPENLVVEAEIKVDLTQVPPQATTVRNQKRAKKQRTKELERSSELELSKSERVNTELKKALETEQNYEMKEKRRIKIRKTATERKNSDALTEIPSLIQADETQNAYSNGAWPFATTSGSPCA